MLRHEINKIRSACQEISTGKVLLDDYQDFSYNTLHILFLIQFKGYKPAITFVVVQKRHHTRLFAMNERDRVRMNEFYE